MDRIHCSAALLVLLCLPLSARADRRELVPHPGREPARRAAGRAITYLQRESAAWLNDRGCAACHHVAMPLWALAEARRQGYAPGSARLLTPITCAATAWATLGLTRVAPER